MKQSKSKNLLVTSCFVLVLIFLIGAGLSPDNPGPESVSAPETEYYTPDAQFAQYLEYRAQLETRTNCQ